MKKIILLILLTLSSLKTSVPSDYGLKIDFKESYDDVYFNYIIETTDNRYVTVGTSSSLNLQDLPRADGIIAKYDKDGNVLWQKNYGGSKTDVFNSVIETKDGGYIAFGYSYSGDIKGLTHNNIQNTQSAIIVKYDKNGNMLWQKNYSEGECDEYKFVIETSDNEYIAVVESSEEEMVTDTSSYSYPSAIIVKYDKNGNMLWQKNYSGNSFNSFEQTSDNGYIAVGYFTRDGGHTNAIIVKYDKDGNMLWNNNYTEGNFYEFRSIIETTNNEYVTVGLSLEYSCDAIIIKYDKDGNILWQKSYDGSDYDYFNSIIETSTDEYIVVGSGSYDIGGIIIKYDKDGNILWQKNYGEGNSYVFSSVIEMSDGGYVAISYGYSGIIKYDKDGNMLWQKNYGVRERAGEEENNYLKQSDDGYVVVDSNTIMKFSVDKLYIDVLPVENGTYTIDDKDGLKVIKPVADDGYEVDKVIVKNSSGENVEVNKDDDGSYTFEMNDNVEVEIIFKENGGKNIIKKFIDNKMIIIIVSFCSIVLLGIVYILFRRSKRVK